MNQLRYQVMTNKTKVRLCGLLCLYGISWIATLVVAVVQYGDMPYTSMPAFYQWFAPSPLIIAGLFMATWGIGWTLIALFTGQWPNQWWADRKKACKHCGHSYPLE